MTDARAGAMVGDAMQIHSAEFTPVAGLVGGALIGLAASVMILANGRVAGVSGVLSGTLRRAPGDLGWRLAFLGGLMVAGLLFGARAPAGATSGDLLPVAVAGLLVGAGTRTGGGCTSGHGVCGLARGSWRSLAATLTFLGAGFATVFVSRHVLR
ncbi:MAG: YeeE/YedE family protein [Polyangiales bacterium]